MMPSIFKKFGSVNANIMKKIEINITPNVVGSTLKIDGQEITGISRITFNMDAIAQERQPEIILEFEGHRANETDFIFKALEDGQKILDKFTHKISGYHCTIEGEFNDYPLNIDENKQQ